MIALDLSKQQEVDADPNVMQEMDFTGNLDQAVNTTTFVITEVVKENILNFSEGSVKVLWNYLVSI